MSALNYSYPQVPTMPSQWIPQNSTSSSSAYRFFTPQMSPFVEDNLSPDTDDDVALEMQPRRRRSVSNQKLPKSNCKHVPHKDKPAHLVAKRNARERRRVQAVNSAFAKLRKCVPSDNKNKRLSKVKTLHRAIEYINNLQAILRQTEAPAMLSHNHVVYSRDRIESNSQDELDDERSIEGFNEFEDYLESDIVVNKENKNQGWAVSMGYEPNYWFNMSYDDGYPGNPAC